MTDSYAIFLDQTLCRSSTLAALVREYFSQQSFRECVLAHREMLVGARVDEKVEQAIVDAYIVRACRNILRYCNIQLRHSSATPYDLIMRPLTRLPPDATREQLVAAVKMARKGALEAKRTLLPSSANLFIKNAGDISDLLEETLGHRNLPAENQMAGFLGTLRELPNVYCSWDNLFSTARLALPDLLALLRLDHHKNTIP